MLTKLWLASGKQRAMLNSEGFRLTPRGQAEQTLN